MNPDLRKRLDDVENALSKPDVVSVPWYVYGISFMPMVGETWADLQDRAWRWLNGEDVPGPYGTKGRKKDPRTRRVSLLMFEDSEDGGDWLMKSISIGDTDSAGVRYEKEPPPARLGQLINQRIEERLSGRED